MQKQPFRPIRNSPKVMTKIATQTWVKQYNSEDQQKCIVEDTEIQTLGRYAMTKKMNKVRIMENATTQVTQTTTPASPLRQAINWTIQKHNRKFIDEWGLEEVIFRRCDKKVLLGNVKSKTHC